MKELYTALAGAVAREKQLAIVTNNLANANSVGFKKDSTLFEVRPPEADLKTMARSADPGLNLPTPRQWIPGNQESVRIGGTTTDFSTGSLRETGATVDFALESRKAGQGAAFFAVQTPQGTRYTRAGNFALNEKKEVLTRQGDRVLAKGGQPLTMDGANVRVNGNGEVMANGGTAGALGLVYIERPERLQKVGNDLFALGQAQPRAVTPADGVVVRQGYLEMANVNIVDELVRMIDLQRSYEAFQKTIQTMDDESSRTISTVLNA